MGLAEAVLAVADEMERRVKEWESVDTLNSYSCSVRLESYAKQLRIAVKAAGGGQPAGQSGESAAAMHRRMVEEAREEFRRAKGREALEESAPRAVEVVDGPAAGTVVDVPGDMPVGAFKNVGGHTYQLRVDGKLHSLGLDVGKMD